jgi:hypothetical protein
VSPTGLEPMPRTSETLTAQNLNVCQSRLGTIIIKTVNIPQHDSAVTGSLSDGKFAWATQRTSNYRSLAEVPLDLCTLPVAMTWWCSPHCNGNSVYLYFFSGNCVASAPISTVYVSVSDLYIPRIGPHISSSRKGRPSWEYIIH